MIHEITAQHKERFEAMKKQLALIGSKESVFIRVELLFYEAMTIATEYGDDPSQNKLLAALRKVQANEFYDTKVILKKSSQQEKVIRRFINQFKIILSGALRNQYFEAVS